VRDRLPRPAQLAAAARLELGAAPPQPGAQLADRAAGGDSGRRRDALQLVAPGAVEQRRQVQLEGAAHGAVDVAVAAARPPGEAGQRGARQGRRERERGVPAGPGGGAGRREQIGDERGRTHGRRFPPGAVGPGDGGEGRGLE
jgi:hypothetical protein